MQVDTWPKSNVERVLGVRRLRDVTRRRQVFLRDPDARDSVFSALDEKFGAKKELERH